jgi:hypothetical protein
MSVTYVNCSVLLYVRLYEPGSSVNEGLSMFETPVQSKLLYRQVSKQCRSACGITDGREGSGCGIL